MSDTLIFYNNKSPSNYLNKTLQLLPAGHNQLTIDFKGDYSVDEPELVLSYDGIIMGQSNYMLIQESGRYYFLDQPILQPGQRMLIKGHLDVLMTYKDQIKDLSPIITRAENLRNSYLPDSNMPIQANIEPDAVAFPSTPLLTAQQFCLIVAGGV